jgi:SpoU rRNA methylase family enzyme
MSDADNSSLAGFGKLVPGFDFLQNLAKQAAGSAAQSIPQLPNLGNWVAPTLNVEELDKRIEELKAVQFWLDQNAMALKATIQALEVQKMTLATLKGMNFNMGDVANAFKLKVADTVAGGVQKAADKARTFSGLEVPPTSYDKASKPAPKAKAKAKAAAAAAPAGVVDPMQWWGALTQQFQNIATTAMQDAAKKTAMDATKGMAAGLARDAVKTATGVARGMAGSAGKTVAQGARSAMNTALRSAQAWPTPAAPAAPRAKPKAKAPARKTAAGKTARKPAR